MHLQVFFVAVILVNTAVIALPAPFQAPGLQSASHRFGNFIRHIFNVEAREEATVIQDYGDYGSYGNYGSYNNPPVSDPFATTDAPPLPVSSEAIPSIPVLPTSVDTVISIPVLPPSSKTTVTVTLEPTTVTPMWSPESFSPMSSTITETVLSDGSVMTMSLPALPTETFF